MSIDNRHLMPKWYPVEEAALETDSYGLAHPDWIKSLIMAEACVNTASTDGTFAGMTRVLEHCAEMGVNGLWLTPIYDQADGRSSYTNFGPHTVSRQFTGTENYEEGWKVVKRFIDEAHKRNIRVFLDIIIYGSSVDSPLMKEHPEWYEGGWPAHAGHTWVWKHPGFIEFYVNAACSVIEKTGADGFRVDLEPDITGYWMFETIRKRLYEQGKYIAIFTELRSEREQAYDFDENSVGLDLTTPLNEWGCPVNEDDTMYYFIRNNIVDCCKTGRGIGSLAKQQQGESGQYRYYTFCLSNHDFWHYVTHKDLITFGYQMIFSPFLPLWFIGEEWDNPRTPGRGGVLFWNDIEWDALEANREFFEAVKAMIRIRREHPEIFTYFPDNHRDANICKVQANTPLQAYARYAEGKTVLILPNSTDETLTVTALRPDVATGDTMCELFQGQNLQADGESVTVTVPPHTMSIVLIK